MRRALRTGSLFGSTTAKGGRMKRREFIALLGGATVSWPLAARGQQPKVPTIGVLVLGTPDPSLPSLFLKALGEELQKAGYIDGQNIRLEVRTAGGNASLLSKAATELGHLKVDAIVTWQTPAAHAAREATSEIPIIIVAGDPVGTGLISSLAQPGGNITGLSTTSFGLSGKLLELIQQVVPSSRLVAVLSNAADPFTQPFLAELELASRTIGFGIHPIMLHPSENFDAAFEDMRRNRLGVVIVQPSLLRKAATDLALKNRLPSFSLTRQWPAMGGLMSYAASIKELYHKTAVYVDKILKGGKAGEIPVEQPTKFELVVNLKTAKALGLTLPPLLLARADEVIE